MKSFFSSPDKIKVGVVGYSGAYGMGKKHLEEMQACGMSPVAVAEINPELLKTAAENFPGIETYSSLDAMLAESKVDLITLITPHNTHAPLAIQALEAGRHVVSEKPLAITTEECDAMIAAANKNGVMLSTYHNRHWDGAPVTALDMIYKQKLIGEVYKIDARMGNWGMPRDWWRSSKSISGGVLYDWGVHFLEYCLQIVQSEITEVSGYAKNGFWGPQIKWGDDANEDEGYAVVRFKNGTWVKLTITQLDSDLREGKIEITGTEGTLTLLDPGTNYRLVQWKDGARVITEGKQIPSDHAAYYRNVAAYLCGHEELVITPEWSRRPIHILDLANKSAIAGKAMPAKHA